MFVFTHTLPHRRASACVVLVSCRSRVMCHGDRAAMGAMIDVPSLEHGLGHAMWSGWCGWGCRDGAARLSFIQLLYTVIGMRFI